MKGLTRQKCKVNGNLLSKANNLQRGFCNQKSKANSPKGITLIALVVTIVVLLILAGVTIALIMNNSSIIKRAMDARDDTTNAVDKEIAGLDNLGNVINGALGEVTVKLADGSKVTLTKENFGDYLGRKVTNYKAEGTEEVQVGTNKYTVSTTYRLYYIDFDNKFGYGAGTVYLKADCTSNSYALQLDGAKATSKIKQLNPELYKEGVTTPANTNDNMKAVTWLTDTSKWKGLVTSSSSTEIASSINYIVGAPSLEMMMDSYNTHYKLEGDTPDYTPITTGGPRKKIFYQYPHSCGYRVGPSADKSAQYYVWTSDNSVQTDSEIDTMYYPGFEQEYWLASPSDSNSGNVMVAVSEYGGYVGNNYYYSSFAFCPLVSLKSNVQLELAD